MAQVYLAGPIRYSDDPHGWRDLIEDEYPDLSFLNPLDWGDHTDTDDPAPSEVVEDDLYKLEYRADAVFCKWEYVATAGTPMEIVYASEIFEIPVVVWNPSDEEVSPWVAEHADAVVDEYEYGMAFLGGMMCSND